MPNYDIQTSDPLNMWPKRSLRNENKIIFEALEWPNKYSYQETSFEKSNNKPWASFDSSA